MPPDPNALRRKGTTGDWLHLPARREGDPPPWPLSRPTQRELALWSEAWHRPQAVAWEANGQEHEVAFYIRTLRQAERQRAGSASFLRTLHAQMDALGLTAPGLRSNRWVIDPEQGTSPGAAPGTEAAVATGPSARERLRLVASE